jgi:hypothetical protein
MCDTPQDPDPEPEPQPEPNDDTYHALVDCSGDQQSEWFVNNLDTYSSERFPLRRHMVPVVDNILLPPTFGEFPQYWSQAEIPEESGGLALDDLRGDLELLKTLNACLQPQDSSQLGKGADASGWGTIPISQRKIQVVRAWRVRNKAQWQKYSAELNAVAAQMTQVPAARTTPVRLRPAFEDAAAKLPGELHAGTNERYLLTGTRKDTVENILTTGLNERFSGANAGTMFGEGLYFAEDGAKVDQYTRGADVPGTGNMINLHSMLYPNDDHPARIDAPQGVQYVFLCRVLLGCTVRTKDGGSCLDHGATPGPLFATPRRRELGEIAGASTGIPYHSLLAELGASIRRFRELVVFNGARVYPEYLLAYSRSG